MSGRICQDSKATKWAKARRAKGVCVCCGVNKSLGKWRCQGCTGKAVARNRKRKYGISQETWDALFDTQGRRCAICDTQQTDKWCTDHDHKTGQVRGILCNSCNRGIGYLRDDTRIAARAAAYLAPRLDAVANG